MARVGRFLGLTSPLLALGMAALMLFGGGYSYEASGSGDSFSSGTVTAFSYAIEQGDYAWLFWSGFIVAICLIAATSVLAGRIVPVWICAVVLYVLAGLGMMSIGLFIFPLAITLFASAILLTAVRYGNGSGADQHP